MGKIINSKTLILKYVFDTIKIYLQEMDYFLDGSNYFSHEMGF